MESFIIVFLSIILFTYSIFVLLALWGWRKGFKTSNIQLNRFNSLKNSVKSTNSFGVSVVIPFRNEASNLRSLLQQPTFFPQDECLFEIILVNDHSTDNWRSTLHNLPISFSVVENVGEGKKMAILTGVQSAKYNTILTTDADCIHPQGWIKSMIATKATSDASMVFGGVSLVNNGSLLGQFQSIDYASMASVGAGYSNLNRPFLCSGANLMFDKNDYLSVLDKLRLDYLSGDDVFLLHAFKEKNLKIAFANDSQSIVSSSVQNSFKALVNQRIRWGSKAVSYTNPTALIISFLVFIVNTCLVTSLFFLFLDCRLTYFIISVYLVKGSTDVIFFIKCNSFWRIKVRVVSLIITSLLYPFWISIIAMLGFKLKGTWKGR